MRFQFWNFLISEMVLSDFVLVQHNKIEDDLTILRYVFLSKHNLQDDNNLLKRCVLVLNIFRNVDDSQFNSLCSHLVGYSCHYYIPQTHCF